MLERHFSHQSEIYRIIGLDLKSTLTQRLIMDIVQKCIMNANQSRDRLFVRRPYRFISVPSHSTTRAHKNGRTLIARLPLGKMDPKINTFESTRPCLKTILQNIACDILDTSRNCMVCVVFVVPYCTKTIS